MYGDNLYLAHHGIKGMRWGVRRYQNEDGSYTDAGKKRRTFQDRRDEHRAKKDAKEYARAKMYYGKGAGNRRKLIKNTVEQRKKDSSAYSEAFDKALAKQDMAKHASAAKRERAVNTTVDTTAKTARGLVNASLGNIGRASASAAAIYTVAHLTGTDRLVMEFAQEKLRNIRR